MINKNYLGHNLIRSVAGRYTNNNYKCTQCNKYFWYQDKDSEYYDHDFVDSKFFIYRDHLQYLNGICNLTCEELIIKNIIE